MPNEELLEECGLEELYGSPSRLPQRFPEEKMLEYKYPPLQIQFYGAEGEWIEGEAWDDDARKTVAKVRAKTMADAARLLDDELSETFLLPQTSLYDDVGKTRRIKDRLEELIRSDPEEFYRRKKIIRDEIERRKRGKKPKRLTDFTLEEIENILKEADMLYR